MLGAQALMLGGGASFSTWDPTHVGSAITLSSNNTVATGSSGAAGTVIGTKAGSGLKYFELTIGSVGGTGFRVGLSKSQSITLTTALGSDASSIGIGWDDTGAAFQNNVASTVWAGMGAWTAGDKLGFAINTSTQAVYVCKNSSSAWYVNGQGFAVGFNIGPTNLNSNGDSFTSLYPAVGENRTSGSVTLNTGASPWSMGPPSGYTALG